MRQYVWRKRKDKMPKSLSRQLDIRILRKLTNFRCMDTAKWGMGQIKVDPFSPRVQPSAIQRLGDIRSIGGHSRQEADENPKSEQHGEQHKFVG